MPQIIADNIVKTFRVAQRTSGTWGAFKGLVRRKYKTIRALDGVSFQIEPGELVGYVGPNGAGKSTTVKVISGILVPDSGRCEILGRVPWKQRVAHVRDIGVVFGQRTQLWWDLPVIESFDLLKEIYRVPDKAYLQTRNELIEILGLSALIDTPVRQLSLGQRMRCDLAAALIHSPSILFLDEPTIGLDAVSKLAVRDFIKQINRTKGTTVILTTHDMDDIEALCSRIMVIGSGRILSDGTLDELRASVSTERRLIVDLVDEKSEISDPDAEVVSREGSRVHMRFYPDRIPPAELIYRIAGKHAVQDLFIENPPIEEIIARLYRKISR
ncbi:MAG: ATP-binding cassette domain-containing protein [Armatimonadota bacterium]